ncbi:unnamed protein product [marine sediment metagenome]|uniref:Uncharacterized protein n=1 Tax=marine sediment metagenome TaxID=412755 RepID=X1LN50_9ZZZZ
MPKQIPVKIYEEAHQTLLNMQDRLPGKPTLISLLDEAIKLLAKKYLKEGGSIEK